MSFCAKCGKEHTEEDIYCSRCGASLKERGDAISEVIDIGYPETENPQLELVIPVSGRLELQSGGEKLVDGTI
ncbi:MAG: zinc ribbon domain-containing protein, partial [Candidatus Bathyarchaeota archaeon]